MVARITALIITLMVASEANATVCEEFRALEEEYASRLPQAIDEYTELTAIAVNCDTETIKYTKRVLVPKSVLPAGAMERKQRQYVQLHCNRDGLASVQAWTAMDVMFDVNYEYIGTLTARPSDC